MKISTQDGPKSVQVGRDEADAFWLTAASWDTGYGPSYEIGIRDKGSGDFWLVQADWDERTVLLAMRAIRLMLNDGMSVQGVLEVFP